MAIFNESQRECIGTSSFKNHAGDDDLKKILDSLIDQSRLEIKECDDMLSHNGIVPPPGLPDRPEAKLEDIPPGARFMDQEIAAATKADIAASLVTCSNIIGMSIREDVGTRFAKYHATKLTLGARLLRLSKDKGWLIPPPLHVKRPELVEA